MSRSGNPSFQNYPKALFQHFRRTKSKITERNCELVAKIVFQNDKNVSKMPKIPSLKYWSGTRGFWYWASGSFGFLYFPIFWVSGTEKPRPGTIKIFYSEWVMLLNFLFLNNFSWMRPVCFHGVCRCARQSCMQEVLHFLVRTDFCWQFDFCSWLFCVRF